MRALAAALTSRRAGWAVVLLAGLAACQGVEFGVGVKPAVPPPDPVLEAAKREAGDAVARQDEAPFVGSGGKLEPEQRLADTPSRLDSIETALAAAGVLKRA